MDAYAPAEYPSVEVAKDARIINGGVEPREAEDDYDDEEVFEVPDSDKTPVTIVTGFLGAGKTTLVNYILKEQKGLKIAVIENEFGAVSIDDALVSENVKSAEELVVMDNGCVCCSVRGDLVKAMEHFLDTRKGFDAILLETTGMADPSPIVATFNAEEDIKLNYRIDSILCLVDAKHIGQQLDRKPEEEGAVNEPAQQLAFADRILLNKIDLVSKEQLGEVKKKIHDINAFAEIVETERSRAPLNKVVGLGSYNLERVMQMLEKEDLTANVEGKPGGGGGDKAKSAADTDDHHSHGGHHHEHGHGVSGHDHDHSGHEHDHSHTHEHAGGEGEDNGKRKLAEAEGGEAAGAPNKKPKLLTPGGRVVATKGRHESSIGSIGLTLPGSLDLDLFNEFMGVFLGEHGQDIFRSKGILSFWGQEEKYIFQGVHEQITCDVTEGGHIWEPDEQRIIKMVFIGRKLDKDRIEKGIKGCILTAEEWRESVKDDEE